MDPSTRVSEDSPQPTDIPVHFPPTDTSGPPKVEKKHAASVDHESKSSSRQSNYSPLISPLPSNAIVFSSPGRDSFDRYIENEYGTILRNKLSSDTVVQHQPLAQTMEPTSSREIQNKASDVTLRDSKSHGWTDGEEPYATFWAALNKDLRDKYGHADGGKKPNDLYDPEKHAQYGYEFNATQIDIHPSSSPWWVAGCDVDGFYSIGALLFIFGFLLPPLWWIGAFWPKKSRERGGKMADRWQKLNKIMSIGFSVVLILAIVIAVIVWKTE